MGEVIVDSLRLEVGYSIYAIVRSDIWDDRSAFGSRGWFYVTVRVIRFNKRGGGMSSCSSVVRGVTIWRIIARVKSLVSIALSKKGGPRWSS